MNMSHWKISAYQPTSIIFSVLLLQACADGIDVKYRDTETNRWYSSTQVAQGKKIFSENCASCHGGAAQGGNNWRVANKAGVYPPPPLNGTGHTWHHPLKMLKESISNGTDRGMPAWKARLTEPQIEATLAWMASHWPDKIYEAWHGRH